MSKVDSLGMLAGSERIGRSEVQGQALKEAQSINRSLSALGDVICALQASAKHIPFRNSKLTQVRGGCCQQVPAQASAASCWPALV